jgi:hypothetical protein
MPHRDLTRHWTAEKVADLPVVVDLVTAGQVLGMGRTAAYESARRGDFPVPVLRVGNRYRVVTAHLRELLGLARTEHLRETAASGTREASAYVRRTLN